MVICMQAVNKQKFVGRFSLSAEWPLQRCNSSSCPNSCFFSKTCDCQPPNERFSQKHAIVNPRTTVFLKNMRLSTPEQLFSSKTSDCQLLNGSPQRCNSSYCPPNRLLQGATAHIAPRIACCKAQQVFIRSMRREQQHFCTVCSTFSTQ